MRVTLRIALTLAVLALATRAEAIPAFARKYGMSCTACHLAWPILNQQGQLFRDNGYQFGTEKDEPVTLTPAYWPVAMRTTAAYQYTRTTNQSSDAGPITVATGGVPQTPGVDILSAGTIARDISFLMVLTGFSPSDGAAMAESAWVRVDNLGGSRWANLKIGKFEVDLPASAHRGVPLTNGYAIYAPSWAAQQPNSPRPQFDLSTNQVGVEFDGHSVDGATRYAISVVSANGDLGTKGAWSSPLIYAHVQQAFETGSEFAPYVRIGALAAMGSWPTTFDTLTDNSTTPATVTNIAGTGHDNKTYSRAGAELTGLLGYPATPFQWQVVYMYGQEAAGLGGPGTPAAHFSGGWLELNWVPVTQNDYNATPWLLFGRYDLVRQGNGPGDFDGFTLGARRYLAVGPRASAAIHLEVSSGTTKGTADNGANVQTQAVMAGIDFAF
jgi:hypothetical protein